MAGEASALPEEEEGSAESSGTISRERLLLVLSFPFALLLGASLTAWPWRALDVPGTVGTLTPPSFLLLAATVAASMYAVRRQVPQGMLTWLPAGQGAVVLLTTGALATTDDATFGFAFIIAYAIVYLLVLGLSLAIAAHGAPLALAFVSLFILTQAARFPVFEAEATSSAYATLFTFLAATRAVLEVGLLLWLVRWLIGSPEGQGAKPAALIVALTVAHGVIAAWEDPLLRDSFTFGEIVQQMFGWLMFVTIQLGMAGVLIRLRRAWWREQIMLEQPVVLEDLGGDGDDERGPASLRRPGRPTPRRRRRR